MNEIYDLHRPHVAIPGYPHAPADWSEDEAINWRVRRGLNWAMTIWRHCGPYRNISRNTKYHGLHSRELHDALDEKFHIKGGMRYLYTLFPGGPVAQGCRLAGLPIPAGAIDRSFGSVQ